MKDDLKRGTVPKERNIYFARNSAYFYLKIWMEPGVNTIILLLLVLELKEYLELDIKIVSTESLSAAL